MRLRQTLIYLLLFVLTLPAPGLLGHGGEGKGNGQAKNKIEKKGEKGDGTRENRGERDDDERNRDKDRDDDRDHDRDAHGDHDRQSCRMRFHGLDRNHDGAITRDEWRGNDRSFSNHDWNGDGVLSGAEVRPGGRHQDHRDRNDRDRQGRFGSLDRNNDGVIARPEWRGDSESFSRMDRNRDGVLSREEFLRRG
jgi:hypothetical protein